MSRAIFGFKSIIFEDAAMVERIKALCKEKGTSIYKLEKELGLGNGTIGKWGKNGRIPNYANLSAVANALGVTVADLTGEADEKGIKKQPADASSADETDRNITVSDFISAFETMSDADILEVISAASEKLKKNSKTNN